ncbi:uncharacterized protein [Haliotis asinina]|uniref:uncharacterized protein isoform X2 n=1 Tax=Haliotis asinina TaxID=109174 RepID=UPI003531E019
MYGVICRSEDDGRSLMVNNPDMVTSASGPSMSVDITVNKRGKTSRSSGNTAASSFMLGVSHGIYLTHRIRRPCTVEIPCPRVTVNIRDGVSLCKGRAKLKRVLWRSPFSPAVVAIHLDLPDEEPLRKFKDLSNHLARVVEEPNDRGFYFWFIRRGQWNTPIRGSSAYFIDLDGKHKEYKIHARDCVKFVVVLGERNRLSLPPSTSSDSCSPSINSNQPHSPPPAPPRVVTKNTAIQTKRTETKDQENQAEELRVVTKNTAIQTKRTETKDQENQAEELRVVTKNTAIQTKRTETKDQENQAEELRNQTHKYIQTNESPSPVHHQVFNDGEEVLARWEDDRWYYKGRIVQRMDNGHYKVKDATGRDDIISWEDIVRIADHYDTVSSQKRASGRVLAPHPIYYWSYAPGRVMETLDQRVTVRFYDNNQKNINRWDVYPARNPKKHDRDVEEIRHREKDWEGLEALVRDDSGVYRLGIVEQQIGRQQKYSVRWDNGQCGEQMSIHIYGTYTPMIKFKNGSYVLALADPDRLHFLPGQVRDVHGDGDSQSLEVDFVNGRRSKDILSKHSYWMNKMAFLEAKEMFLMHHQVLSDEDDSPRYD